MSFAIPVALIIVMLAILLASLVIFACVKAYNKRLDKIAKGETRGTHSSIPDPSTTVTAVYRIIIFVVLMITFIFVSIAYGKVSTIDDNVNEMGNYIREEVSEINHKLDDVGRNVSKTDYELKLSSDNKADMHYVLELRSFSDDTKVTLRFNGEDHPLETEVPGRYSADLKMDLFAHNDDPKVLINENGKTTVEDVHLPEELFWEVLPNLQTEVNSYSSGFLFKNTYEGEYKLGVTYPEDLKSATVMEILDGKEVEPRDATDLILKEEPVRFSGIPDGENFVLRIVMTTNSGYVITCDRILFSADPGEEKYKVEDLNGNLLFAQNYG